MGRGLVKRNIHLHLPTFCPTSLLASGIMNKTPKKPNNFEDYKDKIYQEGLAIGVDLVVSEKFKYETFARIKENYDLYKESQFPCPYWFELYSNEEILGLINDYHPKSVDKTFVRGIFEGIIKTLPKEVYGTARERGKDDEDEDEEN